MSHRECFCGYRLWLLDTGLFRLIGLGYDFIQQILVDARRRDDLVDLPFADVGFAVQDEIGGCRVDFTDGVNSLGKLLVACDRCPPNAVFLGDNVADFFEVLRVSTSFLLRCSDRCSRPITDGGSGARFPAIFRPTSQDGAFIVFYRLKRTSGSRRIRWPF